MSEHFNGNIALTIEPSTTTTTNVKPMRKRSRTSLVCGNCRRKKVRCDKQYPCSNCVKSKCIDTCHYDNSTSNNTDSTATKMAPTPLPSQLDSAPSLPYVSSAKNPIVFANQKHKKQKVHHHNHSHHTNTSPQQHHQQEPVALELQPTLTQAPGTASSAANDQVTISLSELTSLKERLQNIESSIIKNNSSPTSPQRPPPQTLLQPPTPSHSQVNTHYSFAETMRKASTPGVLPPLIASAWSPGPSDSNIFNQGIPSSTSQPVSGRLSTSYNISNTRSQSPPGGAIQLPPLMFNSKQSSMNYPAGFSPTNRPVTHNGIVSEDNTPTYSATANNSQIRPGYGNSTDSSPNFPIADRPREETLLGYNPYLNDEDTINFYEDYTSVYIKEPHRRVNFGPFAWSSLMRRDKALTVLWDYVAKKKEKDSSQTLVFAEVNHEITQENNAVVAGESTETDASFKKRALETDGYTDMIPYNNILKARIAQQEKPQEQVMTQKEQLNKNCLRLGLTFYEGQIDRELMLIDKIQFILPKQKVIWKLIDRFFTWVYPFMPFVDEEDFRESISKIIGPEGYEDAKISEIKVEKRLDLAVIGTLLVMLRLSYLSLFSNKTSVNEERLNSADPCEHSQCVKYLLQNPISINTVDVSQCCLYQFQILRKTSLPVLQLAFYLRLYHTYAPEDGDGADGGDSQTLNAVLIQMAYSLGLNREPDNFPDVLNNKKQNHLCRKIWHYLVLGDIHNSYSFGSPTAIDPNSYDTKFPFHEEGNENLRDKTLDRFVTSCFFPTYIRLYEILTAILKLVLNVPGRTKVGELCKLLSEFEVLMAQKYGSLADCLNPPTKDTHIFARNFPTKFYISLKTFLVAVYYHIFLHYEATNLELSFFYLKKIIKIACTDMMPHYFELLGNSEVICDMMINPKLEQIIHKLNQINLAMIVRVNFMIYQCRSQPDHDVRCSSDPQYFAYYKELCKFSSCVTRCAEVSVAAVSKLSNRYYYAWRITKSHTYLLKIVTNMDFYADEYKNHNDKLNLSTYSVDQIEELVGMCEGALAKLGKQCLIGKSFCKEAEYKLQKSSNSISTASSTFSNNDTPLEIASTVDTDSSSYDNNNNPNNANNDKNNDTFANEFGLNFNNSEEIDKLWIQMLSMKHETTGLSSAPGGPVAPPTPSSLSRRQSYAPTPMTGSFRSQFTGNNVAPTPAKYGTPGLPDLFNGMDVDESVPFDMFGDLPFDQLFSF
ncbi:MRR1 [[Candida] subhashii]|uniref:MRR1 n=1 Tax=[Candida] subhashii TaxID=561895 RepID=A0A8J5UP93_9ASCO|nr:MRR1 [[Candida] subhashii]KAG7664111.1 MRR1 [[Candida] subhashii]